MAAGAKLAEPGTILLVSCYELGHQPLAIASARAFLVRGGFVPATLDLSIEGLDPDRVRSARLVAISVPMHTALRLGMAATRRIRAINPDAAIAMFGLYATLNGDHLLDCGVDAVIGGEFEEPLLALARAIDRGEDGPVPGVRTAAHAARPHLARLDFAPPDRSTLPPLGRYARLVNGGAEHAVGYVEASRGCLHHCRHCPIPPVYAGRFFVVPRPIVREDVRRLVAQGARHITFGDPDFLNGPGHSLAIARDLHREHPSLTFDFTAKVEHLLRHRRALPRLAGCGALFVVTAIESFRDGVLGHLDKGHTRAQALEALDVLGEAGIVPRPTFVPFTPFSTLDDLLDLLSIVRSRGLVDHVDPVQYTIRLLVPPGSLLVGHAPMHAFLGPLDADGLSYTWKHLDPRMDVLQRTLARRVEAAVRGGEDPAVTFGAVRALTLEAAGLAAALDPPPPTDRVRPPRLTEPWFC